MVQNTQKISCLKRKEREFGLKVSVSCDILFFVNS